MADEFSDLVHENFSLKRKLEEALRVNSLLKGERPTYCRDCRYLNSAPDGLFCMCSRSYDKDGTPRYVHPHKDYCSMARRRKA